MPIGNNIPEPGSRLKPDERRTLVMKHVLVLPHDADFLRAMAGDDRGLRHEVGEHLDSCRVFEPPEGIDGKAVLKAMRTRDNIQLYSFKGKLPRHDKVYRTEKTQGGPGYEGRERTQIIGREHLEYWLEKLYQDGIVLDAVVIVNGAFEGRSMQRFIEEELKPRNPNLIVMVSNPVLHEPDEIPADDFYVQATGPRPQFSPHRDDPWKRPANTDYLPVTATSTEYRLRGATIATPELKLAHQNADILRAALGRPAPVRGR